MKDTADGPGAGLLARRVAVAAGLAAFVAYAWLAAPGLYWLDSGELATAAATLGVAHPTGFPLVLLWGKAFALLPLGEIGFRTALGSAAATALAVGVLVSVAARLAGGGPTGAAAAVLAALAFGASLTTVRQATVTEVYALGALAVAGGIALVLRMAAGGTRADCRRAALLLALLCGLSLALHVSFRLLLGPPVALLLLWRLRRGGRHALYAPALAALGAGACLYLPVRAAAHPFLAWGHPDSWHRFAEHMTAERIRRAFAGRMLSRVPSVVAAHARSFARIELGQLGPLVAGLALVGLGALVRRAVRRNHNGARAALLVLLAVVAGDALYSVWVNPMGLDDLQCGEPFALGVALLAAVGAGACAARLRRGAPFVALALACIAGTEPVLARAGEKLRGTTSRPEAWASSALAEAGPRALVLATTDDSAAGLLYAQGVWGARPDVLVVVRQHAWDARELEQAAARAGGGPQSPAGLARFRAMSGEEREARAGDELAALARDALARGEDVLYEPGEERSPPAGTTARIDAPLWRLAPGEGSAAPPGDPVPAAHRLMELLHGGGDPPAAALLEHALVALGRFEADRRAFPAARALLSAALAVGRSGGGSGDASALTDQAYVAAAEGDAAGAADLADRAAAADPEDAAALASGARYRLLAGDDAGAERRLRRALLVAPDDAEALALLGTIEARRQDFAAAARDLCRALARDASQQDARANLAEIAKVVGASAARCR